LQPKESIKGKNSGRVRIIQNAHIYKHIKVRELGLGIRDLGMGGVGLGILNFG